MAISIKCSDKPYKQLPGGHCTVTGAGFRAVVTKHGGRLMSMEVGPSAIEIIDSHSDRFSAVPTVLAKPRSSVTWGDVGKGGGRTWVAPQNSARQISAYWPS